MRREFLQLAKTYNPDKDLVAGWYVSEKLDGTRCFWDGGVSRDVPTHEVPWANIIDPKTGQRKKKIKPVATGLWSRYGNPIIAPDWFLNALPCCPLDGELWAGRGGFQLCRSVTARDKPDDRWHKIEFAVYGSPPFSAVFSAGVIKNTNFHLKIDMEEVYGWLDDRDATIMEELEYQDGLVTFEDELQFLREKIPTQLQTVYLHQQLRLPKEEDLAQQVLNNFISSVLDRGGEGVMLRDPGSEWRPKRVSTLLKYKPFLDAEATIVGFTSGRKTDKGSKHLGKIGALITEFQGKRLELAGLTDEEREFADDGDRFYAQDHPSEDMPPASQGTHFKVGDTVTFKYRELSDDGVPKEARFWRAA